MASGDAFAVGAVTTGVRDAALALVTEFGWTVFRLRITHDEDRCDGGTASCKDLHTVEGEHWSKTGSADPAEVAGWDWSRANAYGIDCGKSGLVVADEDPGSTWPFNGTRVHSTGRGKHHLYEDLIGLGNRGRGRTAPYGVDIKAVGGMVIGPGSYHPHGEYAVEHDISPASPPDELVKMSTPENKVKVVASDLPTLDLFTGWQRLLHVYDRLNAAPDHGINDALNEAAYTAGGIWIRLDPEDQIGELSEDKVKQNLFDAMPDHNVDEKKSWACIHRAWEDGTAAPIPDFEDVKRGWERVFDASPVLRHVQQSAHASAGPATAMLGALIARVAAEVPVRVLLPGKREGSIGSRLVINIGVMIAADSGGGKSTSGRESEDLLGFSQENIQRKPKTSPGMQKSFLEDVRVVAPDGKTVTEQRLREPPVRLFYVDELKSLLDSSGETDNEVIADLCSMLMGEHTGAELATPGMSRNLPANSYRCVMVAGAQTANTGSILLDVDSGTPQRFSWFPGVDPTFDEEAPRPPDPGPLDWSPVFLMPYDGEDEHVVPVPQHIKDLMWRTRAARTSGRVESGYDSHMLLMRLKIAVLLGCIHEEDPIRIGVTDQWWDVAGEIVDLSMAEQMRCRDYLKDKKGERRIAEAVAQGIAQVHRDDVVQEYSQRKERIQERLLEKLKAAGEAGVSAGDMRRSMKAGKQREMYDLLLPVLEGQGVVHVDSSGKWDRLYLKEDA